MKQYATATLMWNQLLSNTEYVLTHMEDKLNNEWIITQYNNYRCFTPVVCRETHGQRKRSTCITMFQDVYFLGVFNVLETGISKLLNTEVGECVVFFYSQATINIMLDIKVSGGFVWNWKSGGFPPSYQQNKKEEKRQCCSLGL